MTFADIGSSICSNESPGFLGLFDLSTPPALLFYSYVPIALLVLFLGVFVFVSANGSRESRWLLAVSLFFFGWVADILVQWVASYHSILLFAWKLNAIFEAGLFLSAFAFVYVFVTRAPLPGLVRDMLVLASVTVLALVPTQLNIAAYDVAGCEGVVGSLWLWIYGAEPALIGLMLFIGFDAWRSARDTADRYRIALGTIGTALAFGIFFFSNYYGELVQTYDFNLWGPIGLVVFELVLGFMIVRYRAFDLTIVAAQALIVAQVTLIGSEFFFARSATNRILVSITFLTTFIFGWFLVRSVRREVAQREEIEHKEAELEVANQQQVRLLHFISHEVKGYLTKAQGVFAGVLEGDYGPVNEEARTVAASSLGEMRKGVALVMDILEASNLRKGTVAFAKTRFDLRDAIHMVVDEVRPMATKKQLILEASIPPGAYFIEGDEDKLTKHVFRNLIENAVKYTPHGRVRVSLARTGAVTRLVVEDSGVGITPEDMQKLFTEGGHGAESQRVNPDSTGYGLFIAKQVVEAHAGRIYAESDGAGKGSRFIVELPTV